MKIEVPTEEEFTKKRNSKRRDFVIGTLVGSLFFIPTAISLLPYGIDAIDWYTWLAIVFGILSFGVLGSKFGSSFWALIKP